MLRGRIAAAACAVKRETRSSAYSKFHISSRLSYHLGRSVEILPSNREGVPLTAQRGTPLDDNGLSFSRLLFLIAAVGSERVVVYSDFVNDDGLHTVFGRPAAIGD